jgi:hypothetical protein
MADRTVNYRMYGPLTELTRARIRELTREPEAIFWVFVFPILLTAILGLAFRSRWRSSTAHRRPRGWLPCPGPAIWRLEC